MESPPSAASEANSSTQSDNNNNTTTTQGDDKCLGFSPNTTPKSVSLARNNLLSLDAVAMDRIFSFLGDEELRRFHQVSRGCKEAVEARPLVNKRRLDLVQKIQENKENIRKTLAADNLVHEASPATRINRDGFKPGTLLLVDCQNLLQNLTPTPTPPVDSNRNDRSLTPIFPFQALREAEMHLLSSGQILIPWDKRLRGSPSTPLTTGSAAMTTATRCRLIARMSDGLSSSNNKSIVKSEPDLPFVALKKSKSHSPLPSFVSPSWLSPETGMEAPIRSRSLGEIIPFCKVSNSNSKKSLRRIARL